MANHDHGIHGSYGSGSPILSFIPKLNTGWWLGQPSEKYESQLGWLDIPNIWENKIDVPKHQPEYKENSNQQILKLDRTPSKASQIIEYPKEKSLGEQQT